PKSRTDDEHKLREVVSHAFMQKRKTLANNLSRDYPTIVAIIQRAGIPEKVRAEELSLDHWHRLIQHLP
ncbi:MAG TPA: hypothetical protein VGI80_06980, partial [Pyrinomonadaceae bacterium]